LYNLCVSKDFLVLEFRAFWTLWNLTARQ